MHNVKTLGKANRTHNFHKAQSEHLEWPVDRMFPLHKGQQNAYDAKF